MSETARRLRAMLDGPEMVTAPFVYDAIQARIAERTGFQAVYMTGFGTAAACGYPDLGLVTMTEMAANVRKIAHSAGVPLICDADTGYGGPVNVMRTVREYEEAGAAALHIEDQAWPKRCGFLADKQVIPLEEMARKVSAACAARYDANFVIIARTDALAGAGWDEAALRARAYRESGADLIFVDGVKTITDLERYAAILHDVPLLYNGQLLPTPELARYGFKLAICTATFFTAYKNFRDSLRELKDTGAIGDGGGFELLEELTDLMGVPQVLEFEKKYAI